MAVYSTLSFLFQHDLWSAGSALSSYKANMGSAVGEPTCEMDIYGKEAVRIQDAQIT